MGDTKLNWTKVRASMLIGTGTTVAVGRPDDKQNRCRTGEELKSSACCYQDDFKKE